MTSNNKTRKMKRSTADRLLKDVKRRIQEVNANDDFCYTVVEAEVFGSYINAPEKDMLSDLDIALRLEPRYPKDSPQFRWKQTHNNCHTIIEQLIWPQEEVLRYIRGRNPYISLDLPYNNPEEYALVFSGPHESIM